MASNSPKQQFLTPVGRLVQGDPFEKQTKNMQGQPLVTQTGQPTQRYFIAVAYSKTECPDFATFYGLLVQTARASFPQLFDANGNCTHPRFSWKVVDGDGVDDNGRPNNQKEGFAGHWVVKFSSSFPPRCFYQGRYQPHEQISDPNVIRRGYFVRVSGTAEGNANPQKPGLYVNLGMVELVAQGPEIVSGPDAAAVFGGTPAAALPRGAVALPTGGAPAAVPQMPGAVPAGVPQMPGAGVPQMPGAGVPQMPGAGVPQMPVTPSPTFAAGPGAQAAVPGLPPPPVAAPAAPVGPQLTPAGVATGYTYAQYIASGWNDAALRQAGYIV